MIYQVWYMKPAFFRDGVCGKLPDAQNLSATHVHLKDFDSKERGLDGVFCGMQGEVWSPNGEARELIKSKGLEHTSMSVGDVIVDDVGNVHVVANTGFKAIGGQPHLVKPPAITANDLAQFTGSERCYRHGLMRTITYTEGVHYLAEKASAYWLIDKVATLQLEPKVRREEFQVWKLKVAGSEADLACEDGNDNAVYSEHIDFTDFPLDEITLWFENGVILLPSEH